MRSISEQMRRVSAKPKAARGIYKKAPKANSNRGNISVRAHLSRKRHFHPGHRRRGLEDSDLHLQHRCHLQLPHE